MSEMDQMRRAALEALEEYNQGILSGGEPDYPQWAANILETTRRASGANP